MPPPSVKDITNIIKKSKPSSTVGSDIINIRVIKKKTPLISPHLTHLYTAIILTQIYPDILKNTRIAPNKKQDKPLDQIDSYRPICNLSTINKIFQQYLKKHLLSFLELHNVINQDHHGSRKDHSTTTAQASINNSINFTITMAI